MGWSGLWAYKGSKGLYRDDINYMSGPENTHMYKHKYISAMLLTCDRHGISV